MPKYFCRMTGGMSMPPVEPPTRTTRPMPTPMITEQYRAQISRSSPANMVPTGLVSMMAMMMG